MQELYELYKYIEAHYIYYSGAFVGILLDKKSWAIRDLIAYILISLTVAHVTEQVLKAQGTSLHLTIVICFVVGLIGHPTFRYTVSEALPQILHTITAKIVYMIKIK